MRKTSAVTGIVTLLFLFAAASRPAGAEPQGSERRGEWDRILPSRASWVDHCARALEDRIRSEHPHTDKVELVAHTVSEWAYSRGEAAVAGDGRMLRGKSWDEFDFVCLVETRSSRVSTLEWSGPLRDDGTPIRPGVQRPTRLLSALAPDSGAGRGCSEAVGAEIRREHPRLQRIEFGHATLRQWRRSQSETSVRGEGQIVGFRGLLHPFEFACVWDARRGGVTAVYYELR